MSRGLQRERDLVKRLRKEGYWALRSPASLGTVDVVAIKHYRERECRQHEVRFIEVKSTAAGPYSHFGPEEREALRVEADRHGASAELCWWPPDRQGPRFIPSLAWPSGPSPRRDET